MAVVGAVEILGAGILAVVRELVTLYPIVSEGQQTEVLDKIFIALRNDLGRERLEERINMDKRMHEDQLAAEIIREKGQYVAQGERKGGRLAEVTRVHKLLCSYHNYIVLSDCVNSSPKLCY